MLFDKIKGKCNPHVSITFYRFAWKFVSYEKTRKWEKYRQAALGPLLGPNTNFLSE